MSKWNCEDEYIKLEKVNQQLLEALRKGRSFLAHHHDCVHWISDENFCDCAVEDIEELFVKALAAAEGDTDE